MVPKAPLLSLLLLLLIPFCVSVAGKGRANYRRFLRQHVDPWQRIMNPHVYCQQEMKARGLTSPTCMKKNTFIRVRNSHVKIMCGFGGRHLNGTFSDSLASYVITTCHSKGGSPPNHCRYRGMRQRRRIRVVCFRGVPVHFRGILPAWSSSNSS